MATRPWELVPPIDEMIVPNKITIKTSHRMPSAAPSGRKMHESCRVIESCNSVSLVAL